MRVNFCMHSCACGRQCVRLCSLCVRAFKCICRRECIYLFVCVYLLEMVLCVGGWSCVCVCVCVCDCLMQRRYLNSL